MGYCELCGLKGDNLIPTIIAGSKMQVCNKCSSHGKRVNEGPKSYNFLKRKKSFENSEEIVSSYNQIILRELNVKQMTPHHLARATNIKESELNQYLSKRIKPDIKTAKKIESFLNIKLVENVQNDETLINTQQEENDSSLTLGDLISKQLKK